MSRSAVRAHPGQDRTSLYEDITNKIIAKLEAGRLPWVQPWGWSGVSEPLAMPKNAATGRGYSGINVLKIDLSYLGPEDPLARLTHWRSTASDAEGDATSVGSGRTSLRRGTKRRQLKLNRGSTWLSDCKRPFAETSKSNRSPACAKPASAKLDFKEPENAFRERRLGRQRRVPAGEFSVSPGGAFHWRDVTDGSDDGFTARLWRREFTRNGWWACNDSNFSRRFDGASKAAEFRCCLQHRLAQVRLEPVSLNVEPVSD
jgi:hypothetical protein